MSTDRSRLFPTPTALDLGRLSLVTGDDPEIARNLVTLLLDDTRRRMAEMEVDLQLGDTDAVASQAHAIAGACINVGANLMADAARQFAATRDVGGLRRRMVELGGALGATERFARAHQLWSL